MKRLHKRPNFKPKHCRESVQLTAEEEAREEIIRKNILFAGQREVTFRYVIPDFSISIVFWH